jgi:hypothetical protein
MHALSVAQHFLAPAPNDVRQAVAKELARLAGQRDVPWYFDATMQDLEADNARDRYAIALMWHWVVLRGSVAVSAILLLLFWLRRRPARILLGTWLLLQGTLGAVILITGIAGGMAYSLFPAHTVITFLDGTMRLIVGFGVGAMLFRSRALRAFACK